MKGKPNRALAARLCELQAHSKISLQHLANIVGVSKTAIWKYLKGETHVPADRLPRFALAYRCDEADLLMAPGSPLPKKFRAAPPIVKIFLRDGRLLTQWVRDYELELDKIGISS